MYTKLKLITVSIILMLFQNNITAQETPNDTLSFSISKARTYALEHNYKMQNARQDVLAANKKVWETTAIGLPQIDGKIDYNNNLIVGTMPLTISNPDGTEQTSYIQMGSPHSATLSLTVSQLIFDGSYIVGLQAAQTYRKISELAEVKSENLVEESVTNAYGGVILSEEIVKILTANVKTLEKNLMQATAYYENGLSEEQNVEQLQILLSTTKNLLFRSERDLETNTQMLKYVLGVNMSQPISLENGVEFLLIDNIDMRIADKQFVSENSIDIHIEDNKVKSQELLKKLEQSKYLPSINAFYNTKQDAFGNSFTFLDSDQDWFGGQVVGVSMNIPIFSSGSRYSKVQQAKIELVKAKNTRLEVEQNLLMNVQMAKNVYLSAINQYYTAKDNMELSKKIRKKEEIKFFEGMSTSLDLSNAEVQMFDTQKSYIGSIQALIAAKAALDRLLKVVPIN